MSQRTKTRGVGKKRKRVAKACTFCKKSKASCSGDRPCTRCVRLGRSGECIDIPPLDYICRHEPDGWANLLAYVRARRGADDGIGSFPSMTTDLFQRGHGSSSASALVESNKQLELELDAVLSRTRYLRHVLESPDDVLRSTHLRSTAFSEWSLPDLTLGRCNAEFKALNRDVGDVAGLRLDGLLTEASTASLTEALDFLEGGSAHSLVLNQTWKHGNRPATSLVYRHREGDAAAMQFSMVSALRESPAGLPNGGPVQRPAADIAHDQAAAGSWGGAQREAGADVLQLPDEVLHEQLLAIGDAILSGSARPQQ
mmetsp:Transcript_12217/g.49069  ORF Transcript_12217/g.49069 Transcript_12217/m.49069 type:complete len:313 (+) Transcript_12217:127-1065(+)